MCLREHACVLPGVENRHSGSETPQEHIQREHKKEEHSDQI